MKEFLDDNLGNRNRDLIRDKTGSFFSSLYGKKWDDLTNARVRNFIVITLIKSVEDNILKIVPEAGSEVTRRLKGAFGFLRKKDVDIADMRESFIQETTNITVELIAEYSSLEELEHRLEKLEQKQ